MLVAGMAIPNGKAYSWQTSEQMEDIKRVAKSRWTQVAQERVGWKPLLASLLPNSVSTSVKTDGQTLCPCICSDGELT